jgi:hypothetical protein
MNTIFSILFAVLTQEGPAETTGYMILGYSVIFSVLGIYLLSIYIRNRNLNQDANTLMEIEEQEAEDE